MIIIIDGLDKCGKTSLALELNKKLPNSIYIKSGINGSKVSQKEIDIYYQDILKLFQIFGEKYNIIIDRFFMSEYVYSFLRGYTSYGRYKEIEEEIKKLKHLYIYCIDDLQDIRKRLDNDYINEYQVLEVYENFRFYNDRTLLNLKEYNFNKNKIEEVSQWVLDFL